MYQCVSHVQYIGAKRTGFTRLIVRNSMIRQIILIRWYSGRRCHSKARRLLAFSCCFPPAEQCPAWKSELHQQRHAVCSGMATSFMAVDEIPNEFEIFWDQQPPLILWYPPIVVLTPNPQHPLAGRVLCLFRPWHKTLPHGFAFLCTGTMLIILYLVLQIYISFILFDLSSAWNL